MYYLKGERWQQPYHRHREKAKWESENFVNLVDPVLKHEEENFELIGHKKNAHHK
jgi:hypothetical protein